MLNVEVLRAVYLVNLTVCLAQNRDWVGKLLRIIGLSLRSYWDTGDRQYVVVSLHCTSLLSLPAIRKDCRAFDIFHEAEEKCVTPWTRVDGNNSKQTTHFRACVTVLVTSRLRWLWTVSALFFRCVCCSLPHWRTTAVSWLASLRVTSAAFDSYEIMTSIYLLGNRDRRIILIV